LPILKRWRGYVLQTRAAESRRERPASAPNSDAVSTFGAGNEIVEENPTDGIGRAPRGLNDAKGFVFISHFGEVFPSGFLPMFAGNVRRAPLAEIYRYSPLFVSLRDTSRLQGKCGVCEFRNVCGGSRARAFAVSGDPFAEEPCCVYEPKVLVKAVGY